MDINKEILKELTQDTYEADEETKDAACEQVYEENLKDWDQEDDYDIPVYKSSNDSIDPNNITIANIARFTGEKPTTIRRIVMEMEKSSLLSTSNKTANKHRKLITTDLDKIQRVLAIHRNNNVPIISAIAELELTEKTGVEVTIMDVQRNLNETKEIARQNPQEAELIVRKYTSKIIDELELLDSKFEDSLRISEKHTELLLKQAEQIDMLQETLERQSKELEELKNSRKKKFLGLF